MNHLLTILGPTASGKTQLAANLGSIINGQIISADSRQVYRKMDIGTGKDLSDYVVEGKTVPYHLIDIVNPGECYNVFEFLRNFSNTFKSVISDNCIPILCGGSGMYLDSVLREYNMGKAPINKELRGQLDTLTNDELIDKLGSYGSLHNTSDTSDKERLIRAIEIADFQKKHSEFSLKLPKFSSVNFGITFERQILRSRITERLNSRLEEGLVEEVESILALGITPDQLMYYGLEYKFVTMHLIGQLSYDQMYTKLNTAIHQFAKRQMTWFRGMEKKGVKINWIDGNIDLKEKLGVILNKIKTREDI